MTVANSAVFDNNILNAFGGLVVWATLAQGSSHTYCELLQTEANLNKATWATYSNTTGGSDQVANGSGYASGGYNIGTTAVALTGAAPNVAKFVASSTSTWGSTATFSATTALFQYGASNGTTAGNPLESYHDLTGGTGTAQQVVSGTLTLTWAGTGVYTITISTAQ